MQHEMLIHPVAWHVKFPKKIEIRLFTVFVLLITGSSSAWAPTSLGGAKAGVYLSACMHVELKL